MAKVNDNFANPTPLLNTPSDECLRHERAKLKAMNVERLQLVDELARLDEEIEKTLKQINDLNYINELMASEVLQKREQNRDADGEYQNLIDNEMMHEQDND